MKIYDKSFFEMLQQEGFLKSCKGKAQGLLFEKWYQKYTYFQQKISFLGFYQILCLEVHKFFLEEGYTIKPMKVEQLIIRLNREEGFIPEGQLVYLQQYAHFLMMGNSPSAEHIENMELLRHLIYSFNPAFVPKKIEVYRSASTKKQQRKKAQVAKGQLSILF